MQPVPNGANFGGRIDNAYKGINGVKNKTDRAKIKIDFKLTNLRFNPIKSVFSCIKKRSGPVANEPKGE